MTTYKELFQAAIQRIRAAEEVGALRTWPHWRFTEHGDIHALTYDDLEAILKAPDLDKVAAIVEKVLYESDPL